MHGLYFLLHTSYSMCMYIPSACFSGSVYNYIHLMSTTQLDRSRSPTMPCILLVLYRSVYIHTYIHVHIQHGTSMQHGGWHLSVGVPIMYNMYEKVAHTITGNHKQLPHTVQTCTYIIIVPWILFHCSIQILALISLQGYPDPSESAPV